MFLQMLWQANSMFPKQGIFNVVKCINITLIIPCIILLRTVSLTILIGTILAQNFRDI